MESGQTAFTAAVCIHDPVIGLKIKRFYPEFQIRARHPDDPFAVRGILCVFIPGHRRVLRHAPRASAGNIHFIDFERPVLIAGEQYMAVVRAEIVAFEKGAPAAGIVISDSAQPGTAVFIEVKIGNSQDPFTEGPPAATNALGPEQPGAVV